MYVRLMLSRCGLGRYHTPTGGALYPRVNVDELIGWKLAITPLDNRYTFNHDDCDVELGIAVEKVHARACVWPTTAFDAGWLQRLVVDFIPARKQSSSMLN